MYLCGRWVTGCGSGRGSLGWAVGALRGQAATALGLTETFAVLFADLQRAQDQDRLSAQTQTVTGSPHEGCKSWGFIKCQPAEEFKRSICEDRDNVSYSMINTVKRKHSGPHSQDQDYHDVIHIIFENRVRLIYRITDICLSLNTVCAYHPSTIWKRLFISSFWKSFLYFWPSLSHLFHSLYILFVHIVY